MTEPLTVEQARDMLDMAVGEVPLRGAYELVRDALIAAAVAQGRAEAGEDAARWEWLLKHRAGIDYVDCLWVVTWWSERSGWLVSKGEDTPRAAIDAARAAEQEGV